MKFLRIICLMIIVIWPIVSTATEPMVFEWDKTYKGLGYYSVSNASSSIQTNDGGYIVVGSTKETYGSEIADVFVVKTDSAGYEEWVKTYGGVNYDSARSVIQTQGGGYLIAGTTKSYGSGGSDIYLIKIDSQGNEEWNETYGGIDDESTSSMIQSQGGGYLIAGTTKSYGSGDSDAYLIKIDAEGNEEWHQTYGGSGYESANAVIETPDGGYLFVGQSGRDSWTVKVDSEGNMEWKKHYDFGIPANTSSNLNAIEQAVDGGYIFAGSVYDAGQEMTSLADLLLIKIDAEGNTEWNKFLEGGAYDWSSAIHVNKDGYIITANSGLRIWLVQTDFMGNIIWSEFYKKYNSGRSNASSGHPTNDGGYMITGTADIGASFVFWLIKIGHNVPTRLFTLSDQEFPEIDFGVADSEMGDVDGDGDLDIVFSGFNGTSSASIYINDGTGNFTDSGQSIGGGVTHDLLLKDFDNDGDLDLVICVNSNLKIFWNDGLGEFTDSGQSLVTNKHYMLTSGDFDNDGDIDIIAVTEHRYYARLYLNNGQGMFSDYRLIPAIYCHEPTAGDLNGDGVLDVGFAMNWISTFLYFNDGNATFPERTIISGGYRTQGGVYFADVDGDEDLDIFEANYSGDSSKLFWNDGSGSFTDSTQDFGAYLDRVTKAAFGDIDNDGDIDLLASGGYAVGEAYYLNDSTGQFTKGDDLFKGGHISLGDVDNDGDLDVISGNSMLYINNTASILYNTPPTQPRGLQAVRDSDVITFSWESGSDNEAPTELLTYNLRVGTTEGGNDIFSGVVPSGPGNIGHTLTWFIKGLNDDIYYWAVQTIDSGFRSSPWTSAQFQVYDNHPPIADAGKDKVVFAGSGCAATITLDGSGSNDEDSDALTYTWTWDGSMASSVFNPTINLPLGTTSITLVVNDGSVDSEPDTVNITVIDATPPEFNLTATPVVLWPPNHEMVPVTLDVAVSDTCDLSPRCEIVPVKSNEPENGIGDEDTDPDWEITGDLTVNLRAERSGKESGRVYTVTVMCTDASGNSSKETANIIVPHDQGKKK